MAKQSVNIGTTANDNTGDPLRTAFNKLNSNHDEIYAAGPVGTNLQVASNTISSTNSNGNITVDPAGTGSIVLSGPTDAQGVLTLSSTVTGNILPTANNSQTLGSGTAQYSEVHGTVLHVGSLILREVSNTLEIFRADDSTNAILNGNSTTSGSVLANGDSNVTVNASGNIQLFSNTSDASLATTISTSSMTTPAITVTGNVAGGNITTGAQVVATGNVTGGNLITGAQVVATGNITGGNLVTAGLISATGNITGGNIQGTAVTGTLATAAQPNITSVGTLSAVTVTGNVAGGNLTTGAQVAATGNITGGNLITAADTKTATVTYLGDSTVQSTAYKSHLIRITSDGSAIDTTLTDVLGAKFTLQSGRMYEIEGTVLLTNSSTGNISVRFNDSATQITNMSIIETACISGGAFASTNNYSGSTGTRVTSLATAATFAILYSGFITVSGNTNVSLQASVASGTITPKAGSYLRLSEHIPTTIGDTV